MSGSLPSCGYFVNTSYQADYGFVSLNLLPSSTNTFTVIWQTPMSGIIVISSTPISQGYYDEWYFPTGATYYAFVNQIVWSANIDLSQYYVAVMVYNAYVPVCFSIQVDGQTLTVAQILQRSLSTTCCQQINGYVTEIEMNNGLQLARIGCSSFGLVSGGDTTIPLGGSCTCGGITFCGDCPDIGNITGNTPEQICQIITPSAPCSLPRFLNLPVLNPPAKKSVISSSLWNAIVNNIYSAYNSLVKIKNALSLANYTNLLNQAYAIYDALYTPTPYAFTPLLTASKGVPLTADDFNALVKALEQVYNEVRQPLPYSISPAFPDSVVRSETFAKIVENLNALRQSALQSVLLTSTYGNELNNLPSNFSGQNVLVCSISTTVTLSGAMTIENLLIVQIASALVIGGNVSISRLVVQNLYDALTLQGTANVQNAAVGMLSGTLEITDFASVQNLFVNEIQSGGSLIIGGNAYIQNLVVNSCSSGSIVVEDYALVNNMNETAQQCVSTSSS